MADNISEMGCPFCGLPLPDDAVRRDDLCAACRERARQRWGEPMSDDDEAGKSDHGGCLWEVDADEDLITTRRFTCPCCRAVLQFRAEFAIRKVRVVEEGATTLPKRNPPAKARGRQIAELMNGGPFMNAFLQALVKASTSFLPKDPAEYFTHVWLKKITRITLPRFAYDRLREEFGDGFMEVFGAEGVEAVVVAGRIRQFIPHYLLAGRRVTSGTRGEEANAPRVPPNPAALDEWIRTKYGYVPDEGPFMDALIQAGRAISASTELKGSMRRT